MSSSGVTAMPSNVRVLLGAGVVAGIFGTLAVNPPSTRRDAPAQVLAEGKQIFRFDTFGDEKFWTDTARIKEVVQSSVSPSLALKVGLKVDAEAIPPAVAPAIQAGQEGLKSPPTPLTLVKLDRAV